MFLCIDCGLTNGKVLLFAPDGTLLDKKAFQTPLYNDQVDTKALYDVLCGAIGALTADMDGTASQITCVSVSGHGNGLYALDEAGALPFGFFTFFFWR